MGSWNPFLPSKPYSPLSWSRSRSLYGASVLGFPYLSRLSFIFHLILSFDILAFMLELGFM